MEEILIIDIELDLCSWIKVYIYVCSRFEKFFEEWEIVELNIYLKLWFSFFNVVGYSILAAKSNIWKFLGEVYWVKNKIYLDIRILSQLENDPSSDHFNIEFPIIYLNTILRDGILFLKKWNDICKEKRKEHYDCYYYIYKLPKREVMKHMKR